jgi:hypothetical protein
MTPVSAIALIVVAFVALCGAFFALDRWDARRIRREAERIGIVAAPDYRTRRGAPGDEK